MTAPTVLLDADELLGLQAVALLSDDDLETPESRAKQVLRAGLAARLDQLGLPWAPTPDDVAAAVAARRTRTPSRLAALRHRAQVRAVLRALLVGAAVVALGGGYAGGWSWTGFPGNNQLWDWLQLLLLPVAFATLPIWLKHGAYLSRARRLAYAGSVAAFAVFVVIGYTMPLGWTGFTGNRLWDWLTLILLPVTLITVRTWPSTTRSVTRRHLAVMTAGGTAWVVTILGGYVWGWTWTGYQGNTLWDWLQLLLLPIVFPTILAPALLGFVTGNVERHVEAERQRRLAAPV